MHRPMPAEKPRISLPQIESAEISLVPFPPGKIADAWGWLHEFPKANLDDDGPKTIDEFREDLLRKTKSGHVIIGVLFRGECVGIIAVKQCTKRRVEFAGICFSKAVHGRGVARNALEKLFQGFWAEGIEKVEARHFADNQRIARLFAKIGGRLEGHLRKHAVRDGKPIDVRMVGWIKGE